MGKKEFSYEIIDNDIEVFSEKPNTDWCKAIVKISWGDKPASVDIRNIKMGNQGEKPFIGKGISLSDQDVDTLTDMLIHRGYGSTEAMEQEIVRRKKIFNGFDLDVDVVEVSD